MSNCASTLVKTSLGQENRATHGIVAIRGTMPHGIPPNLKGGVDWVFKKKSTINFCSQLHFVQMKASLIAYYFRELSKKSEIKIEK
jgi:hypothetical protein